MNPTPPTGPDRPIPDAAAGRGADVLGPLLATVVFGFYGFLSTLTSVTTDADGNTVALWVGSLWILRGSTILFLVATVLAIMRTRHATLASGIAGMLATVGLAAILIWDQLDTVYYFACPPLILLVFIAWNGFTSFLTLRDALRGG